VLVAEKRLRHLYSGAAAYLFLGGNMMKNKKTVLALVALALVIGIMAAAYMITRPEAVAGSKTVTVTVVHSDGSEKVLTLQTDAEYLGTVLLEEKIVEGEMGPYGLMISAVDGEAADWNVNQSYWALYEGDAYATTGADAIVLTDGSSYKLEYTIG
jgi:hypothetical protein